MATTLKAALGLTVHPGQGRKAAPAKGKPSLIWDWARAASVAASDVWELGCTGMQNAIAQLCERVLISPRRAK